MLHSDISGAESHGMSSWLVERHRLKLTLGLVYSREMTPALQENNSFVIRCQCLDAPITQFHGRASYLSGEPRGHAFPTVTT